jgi:hypothetical protein
MVSQIFLISHQRQEQQILAEGVAVALLLEEKQAVQEL